MNWEAISAIGEIVSAIAVLATLVYLSMQIRQNGKMMKANSKQSISEATQQLLFKTMDEPEVMRKIMHGGSFDADEHTKAWILCRAMLRGYEAQIYQHEVGLLDEKEWNELRGVICQTAILPGFKEVWPELAESVSPALRQIIEKGK
jgi:hypothetical protein